MLRTLIFSITCITLGIPTVGKALDFASFACQPIDRPVFLVYAKFGENGTSWQVGDLEMSVQETGYGGATLTEMASSTMLVFREEGDLISFRGLLEGDVIDGQCTDATQEILAAIQLANPSMHKEIEEMRKEIRELKGDLSQAKRLLKIEADTKQSLDASVKTLNDQLSVEVDRNQACEADLSEALIARGESNEVKQLNQYLENSRKKVGRANQQISQLCASLASLGYETVKDGVPISECRQVR